MIILEYDIAISNENLLVLKRTVYKMLTVQRQLAALQHIREETAKVNNDLSFETGILVVGSSHAF